MDVAILCFLSDLIARNSPSYGTCKHGMDLQNQPLCNG